MSSRTRRQQRKIKDQEDAAARNTYLRFARRHWLSVLPIVVVAALMALVPWSQTTETKAPPRTDTAEVVTTIATPQDTAAAVLTDLRVQDIDFSGGALVMDQGAMLSSNSLVHLDSLLQAVNARSQVQVGLLTVPGMAGAKLEEFSLEAANAWALGEEGKDNGIMVFLSRKDRKMRIEVGKGLKTVLTREECLRIIDSVMVPRLKAGNVDDAVVAGMESILAVVEPGQAFEHWSPTAVKHRTDDDRRWVTVTQRYPWQGFFVLLLAPLFLFVGWKRSREGSFAWLLLPLGYAAVGALVSTFLVAGIGLLLFAVTVIHVVRTNSGSSSDDSDWSWSSGDSDSGSSSSDSSSSGSGGGSFDGSGGSGSW